MAEIDHNIKYIIKSVYLICYPILEYNVDNYIKSKVYITQIMCLDNQIIFSIYDIDAELTLKISINESNIKYFLSILIFLYQNI